MSLFMQPKHWRWLMLPKQRDTMEQQLRLITLRLNTMQWLDLSISNLQTMPKSKLKKPDADDNILYTVRASGKVQTPEGYLIAFHDKLTGKVSISRHVTANGVAHSQICQTIDETVEFINKTFEPKKLSENLEFFM